MARQEERTNDEKNINLAYIIIIQSHINLSCSHEKNKEAKKTHRNEDVWWYHCIFYSHANLSFFLTLLLCISLHLVIISTTTFVWSKIMFAQSNKHQKTQQHGRAGKMKRTLRMCVCVCVSCSFSQRSSEYPSRAFTAIKSRKKRSFLSFVAGKLLPLRQ